MLRRRGGAGLLSTVARTAVIAGTATAVSNRVAGGQAQRAAAQQHEAQAAAAAQNDLAQVQGQLASLQAQQLGAAAQGGPGEMLAQLQQLAQLREANMLTDEEFATAKARLLAG